MDENVLIGVNNNQSRHLSVSVDQTTLGNVDTIQELTDILVSDSADLLDVGTVLGNSLQGVTRQDQLVLLGGGVLDGDTIEDLHLSDSLLTQEVSDLNVLLAVNLNNVDVDWEMRIDVSHLVLVTLGDTGNQVSNQGLDGSQSSNVLSVTVVDSDLDGLVGNLGEGNVNVLQVLGQLTSWTGDLDGSGLDVDGNALWDFQDLIGLDVLHCWMRWKIFTVREMEKIYTSRENLQRFWLCAGGATTNPMGPFVVVHCAKVYREPANIEVRDCVLYVG